MQQEACQHDFTYHGALNFFKNKELITVVEAWRCRKCGVLRLGRRGPEVLLSSEGMYPDIEPGKEWVVFLCLAGEEPVIEVYQMRPGDEIPHTCDAYPRESVLVLDEDFSLRLGKGDGKPSKHFAYKFSRIVKGYIEMGSIPPEVVTLTRTE